MKKLTLLSACSTLLLLAAVATHAQEKSSEQEASINWIDLTTALELAPQTGKLVLIDFYTDWCGWCKRMDKTTYADSAVMEFIAERVHASKVNPEKNGEIVLLGETYTPRQFAQGLNVTGYPTTCIVVHEEGEEKPMVVPRPGYMRAEQLLQLLEFYDGDAYKTMSFQEFVESRNTADSQ